MQRRILLFFGALAVMGQGTYDPHVIRMPDAAPGAGAPSRSGPTIVEDGPGAVAWRGRSGTFELRASINGETLPMIVDTGASIVTIRAEDAERAGIDVSRLRYTLRAHTANGTSSVAPVIIQTLQIGSIIENNVLAVIARPNALPTNLLGQSFLSRLRDYTIEKDRVVFRAR